ncbi:MAG: DNA-3-methyladenine glycosylase [Firmicutes bacterium]|nr:DNA-3-methyladenine glycosylase [Bacillota bacterium]
MVGKMAAGKLPKTAAENLPREFYERDVVTVARELLGKTLVHANAAGVTRGIIVEAEAYRGPEDRAAHSHGNLRSKRTSVMFGPGGHAYVFLIYGMYCCFNVVAATTDQPQAVLIRALEPLEGIDLMAARRGVAIRGEKDVRKLASGPGKLTIAMGIDMSHNGLDFCGDELYITAGRAVAGPEIAATRRINVDYAGEWKDRPWRFVIRDSPFLSVKKA